MIHHETVHEVDLSFFSPHPSLSTFSFSDSLRFFPVTIESFLLNQVSHQLFSMSSFYLYITFVFGPQILFSLHFIQDLIIDKNTEGRSNKDMHSYKCTHFKFWKAN